MTLTPKLLALLLAMTGSPLVFSAKAAETLWLRQLDSGTCDSSIVYADVAPAPGPELVMTTTSGSVVVLGVDGRPLHQVHLGGVFSTPPTAAEIFPGVTQQVLVVNQAGLVTCLEGERVLWHYPLPSEVAWNNTTIVAEDLDGDDVPEILVGDAAGEFFCLAREGVERWKLRVPGGFHCPPAVADLRPDRGREIVISTGSGKLLCVSAAGKALWEADLGCDNTSGPVIADLRGDGGMEIVVGGRDNRLHCYDAKGKPRWSVDATGEIDSSIACGDIEGDGKIEIVFVDLRGKCFCVGHDGKLRWRYDVRNRCRRPPSLADFDGDGEIEALVIGYDSRMYLLSHDGQEKDIVDVPGTTNGGATLIDGDGRLCAAVPFGNGKVGCYTWLRKDAGRAHRALWGSYRVTASQRGSVLPAAREKPGPSRERIAYGEMLVGRNVFEVNIANPTREKLAVELRVTTAPTGTDLADTVESDAETIPASLPYLVRGESPETFVFSYAVKDRSNQTILSGRKAVFVEPFVRDLDAVRSLIEMLKRAEAKLRDVQHRDARELAARRLWFEQRLADLAGKVSHPSRLQGADRVACSSDLGLLASQIAVPLAAARITLDLLDAGRPPVFAVWNANPWSPIRPLTDRASPAIAGAPPVEAKIMLYRNERGSLAVDVLNLLEAPLDLRMRYPERFDGQGTPALSVAEVIGVPTELLSFAPDAISPLNNARVIHIAPGELRQIWIAIDATASKPGAFTCKINLSSLTADSVAVDVPVKAEIVDLDITAAPAPRFCNWAYLNTSCVKEYEAEARRDLVAHGTNVFVVDGGHMPHVEFDATGRLVTQPDFTRHDRFIADYGPDAMFLFGGPQGTIVGPKEHGFGSEAYRKAYLAWIPQWVAHLARLGVGYDRFAFYPVDEPGLTPGLVEHYIEVARLTRQADPRVQMYTDPVGRATLEEIERMAPFVDIWCPNRNGYLTGADDPRLRVMRKPGKQVWTYECDGNAKNLSPLGYYRGLAWLAERNELTGIGFWSYCTSSYDPWYVPRGDHDYLLIYPGAGVISSKRWEACRDGLEDLRAVWQLKALADAARRKNPEDGRVKRADAIRASATAELAEFFRYGVISGPTTRGATSPSRDRSTYDVLDEHHRAYERHRQLIADASIMLGK